MPLFFFYLLRLVVICSKITGLRPRRCHGAKGNCGDGVVAVLTHPLGWSLPTAGFGQACAGRRRHPPPRRRCAQKEAFKPVFFFFTGKIRLMRSSVTGLQCLDAKRFLLESGFALCCPFVPMLWVWGAPHSRAHPRVPARRALGCGRSAAPPGCVRAGVAICVAHQRAPVEVHLSVGCKRGADQGTRLPRTRSLPHSLCMEHAFEGVGVSDLMPQPSAL